jgi:hypothetical protein
MGHGMTRNCTHASTPSEKCSVPPCILPLEAAVQQVPLETSEDVQSVFVIVCKCRPACLDGSAANSWSDGVAIQGMSRRGSARSATMAVLNQHLHLTTGTLAREHTKHRPALLEQLACVPLSLSHLLCPAPSDYHAHYLSEYLLFADR